MRFFRMLSVFVALSMVLSYGFQPAAGPVQAARYQVDLSKVDPQVLNAFQAESSVEFTIIMAEQADISGAAALKSKVEKTTYVFNLLRETSDRTQQGVLRFLDAQGAEYRSWYIMNMVSTEGTRQVVEALTAMPEVAKIVASPQAQLEPVWRNMSTDLKMQTVQRAVAEQLGVEWNIARVHAPEVWAMGIHGEGYVVAGNDTGVDYTHPALLNKYRGNLGDGSFNHNYNWWGGGGSSLYPTDSDGHGTHTMGTMVGDDGGTNQIGVAPGAKWIACAGLGGSNMVECFEFFLAPWDLSHNNPDPTKAPDAINNSWYDTSGFDYRPIIQNLNAAGIAVIKSAGNWGAGCDTISPPGNVPEIISTAAFGQGDVVASFSSRGPNSDYGETILKPEVAAPGVNVRSSVPGGGYDGTYSGTSMAAPHSTAMVALMWSAAPCLAGDVPTTKQIMMETAESKIDAQCSPFVDHPNDVWGWGILDMEAAVQYAIGYCGGLGAIEGIVSSGGAPLQDVLVEAAGLGGFAGSFTTGADGLYEMQVLSDTYTVTATKYGYEPGLQTGIEVTADMTATVDFDLAALPVYTISGYVREAGSNIPLAAVVEITGAPVPPVNTDPATGFYSIEVAEGTWTFQAAAADHAAQTITVEVTGNQSQNFSLAPFCNILDDDVESGNLGWTADAPWAIVTEASYSPTHSWTDSPGGSYQNYADTSLTSPVYDLSQYNGLALNFWHEYETESGYDYAKVEYSTNGGTTWTAAATYEGSHLTWTQEEISLPQLDGQANVRIRFHLTTDVSVQKDGWHVDDIVLFGGGPACVPAAPPAAEFSSNSPVLLTEPVVFMNETGGSEPLSFEWDFGDQQGTYTDTNPSYTYTEVGIYTVTLTATNDLGTDVVTHTVEVLPWPDIAVAPQVITVTLSQEQSEYAQITIENLGDSPLVISDLFEDASWLQIIDPPGTPYTLNPGESDIENVEIDAAGLTTGTYTTTLTITSNDPDEEVIIINITLVVVTRLYLPIMMKP